MSREGRHAWVLVPGHVYDDYRCTRCALVVGEQAYVNGQYVSCSEHRVRVGKVKMRVTLGATVTDFRIP